MQTENASPSVISVSQNKIKEYARLYFRPRTPTQYHNEGYKPKHIRNKDVNANCPLKQAVQVTRRIHDSLKCSTVSLGVKGSGAAALIFFVLMW